MSAPIRRISPELDALIDQLAEENKTTYIQASRMVAANQVDMKQVPQDALQLFTKIFKDRDTRPRR